MYLFTVISLPSKKMELPLFFIHQLPIIVVSIMSKKQRMPDSKSRICRYCKQLKTRNRLGSLVFTQDKSSCAHTSTVIRYLTFLANMVLQIGDGIAIIQTVKVMIFIILDAPSHYNNFQLSLFKRKWEGMVQGCSSVSMAQTIRL